MSASPTIRSVERSIAVLRAMNASGVSRIGDLRERTGLPTTTIVRILNTLIGLGYVQGFGRRGGYALTEKVLELTAGYHGLPLFIEDAKAVLLDLTGAIR